MIEKEQSISDTDLQKEKIRQRYKGVDPDILEVIPATKKQVDFYDEEPKRVAVYVRVSTDDPRQTSSFELQKNYYEDMVTRYPTWTLVEIYADEGISGTSLNHRDSFNRMIADAKAGKMDIIITKSVSRFARNIVDCVQIVRDLTALKQPVGVFFETEHIYTLNDNTEMSLSFIATMAQEESHVKSSIMNASIEMRFSHGILLTPVLLGYDHDDDGNLVINEDEAQTARLIFFMYLYGYSATKIAETLEALKRKTKRGNTTWTPATILQILKNERYCGDVLSRKTYTPSYLDHKTKKNEGDKPQYRFRNHHEAIISRDDFIAVQHMISNAKYGSTGILPKLAVIQAGTLQGFVRVNTRWGGFTPEDYIRASDSIVETSEENIRQEVLLKDGEFNYAGFEVARAQFFDDAAKISVTLMKDGVVVNKGCFESIGVSKYAELLIHPAKNLLAIRTLGEKQKDVVKWYSPTETGELKGRKIFGKAYMPTLYELFGWNKEYKYRLRGYPVSDGDRKILMFNVFEPEILIPRKNCKTEIGEKRILGANTRTLTAYPEAWAEGFGEDYYRVKIQKIQVNDQMDADSLGETAVPYDNGEQLHMTDPVEIERNIHSLISKMKESAM